MLSFHSFIKRLDRLSKERKKGLTAWGGKDVQQVWIEDRGGNVPASEGGVLKRLDGVL